MIYLIQIIHNLDILANIIFFLLILVGFHNREDGAMPNSMFWLFIGISMTLIVFIPNLETLNILLK